MNTDDFLNEVCKCVKYKSVHMEIRSELREHIYENIHEWKMSEEEAVTSMGDPKEIGKYFNENFRMPFNSRYGLCIWSAMITVFIYLIYPIFVKLFNNTINTGFNTIIVILFIAGAMVLNVKYLRRSMLKWSLRDILHVTIGFFVGYAAAAVIFLPFFKSGYYPYMSDVKLPIVFPYIPLLPKNQVLFGLEFFAWWGCVMIYIVSALYRKKDGKKGIKLVW